MTRHKFNYNFKHLEKFKFDTLEQQIEFLDSLHEGVIICILNEFGKAESFFQKKWISLDRGTGNTRNAFEWCYLRGNHSNLHPLNIKLLHLQIRQDVVDAMNFIIRGATTAH
jgi:hypothetical protein